MYKTAIIVLGCGIDAAGRLNPDAEGSVRLAIAAAEGLPGSCLIMTGYVSYKADFRPSISEAQAMKDYAVTLGYPAESIWVETESKDSLGNLYFTRANLLMPLGIMDLRIVRGPNQSDERITYLADKVLGADYHYELLCPDISRPAEAEREQKSLRVAKEWLDTVEAGDMMAIYRLFREKHPGYNSAVPALKELL